MLAGQHLCHRARVHLTIKTILNPRAVASRRRQRTRRVLIRSFFTTAYPTHPETLHLHSRNATDPHTRSRRRLRGDPTRQSPLRTPWMRQQLHCQPLHPAAPGAIAVQRCTRSIFPRGYYGREVDQIHLIKKRMRPRAGDGGRKHVDKKARQKLGKNAASGGVVLRKLLSIAPLDLCHEVLHARVDEVFYVARRVGHSTITPG